MAATVRHVSPALDAASERILVEADLAVSAEIAANPRPGLAAVVRPAGTETERTGTRVL